MNTNRRHAVAALIAAGLLWGTTVPLSKLALEWLSPGWLTAVRFGLATAVLLAVARARGVRGGGSPRGGGGGRGVGGGGGGRGGGGGGGGGGPPRGSTLRAAFTPGVLIAGAFGYG